MYVALLVLTAQIDNGRERRFASFIFPLYIYKDVKIPGYSHRRLFFGRFVLLNGGESCGQKSKDAFLLRGDAGRGEHQHRVERAHDLLRSLH